MSDPAKKPIDLSDSTIISMKAFRESKAEADSMLKRGDTDEIEKLLLKLENKLKGIPKVGKALSHIPIFISLIRSYIRKEYTVLPVASAVGILTALIYFLSPLDLIPDAIPGIGHLDDAAVVAFIWVLVEADVENFQEWRKNKKHLE